METSQRRNWLKVKERAFDMDQVVAMNAFWDRNKRDPKDDNRIPWTVAFQMTSGPVIQFWGKPARVIQKAFLDYIGGKVLDFDDLGSSEDPGGGGEQGADPQPQEQSGE